MRYDFSTIDLISAILVGMILGTIIGAVVTRAEYKNFDKFCPECGYYYKAEEKYCSFDGSELKVIGGEEE